MRGDAVFAKLNVCWPDVHIPVGLTLYSGVLTPHFHAVGCV